MDLKDLLATKINVALSSISPGLFEVPSYDPEVQAEARKVKTYSSQTMRKAMGKLHEE